MDGLSEQEIEVILDFRSLTETQQEVVVTMLRAMTDPISVQAEFSSGNSTC